MSDLINPVRYSHAIYVNGMLSTVGSANRVIKHIPQGAHFYNNATGIRDVSSLSFALISTISCLLSSQRYYRWMGLSFLMGGYGRFQTIEMRKSLLGLKLFYTIKPLLEGDQQNRLLLILHSEGASIGKLALTRLIDHKPQIDIVVLGGKEGLSSEWNALYFNHRRDMIASLSQMIHQSPPKVYRIDGPCKGVMDCHRAIRYIRDMNVKNTIMA